MFDFAKSPFIDTIITGFIENQSVLHNNGYCFLCILDGNGSLNMKNQHFDYSEKDVFFIPPETDCTLITQKTTIIFCIIFNYISVENLLGNQAWKHFGQNHFDHSDYNTSILSHHLAQIAASWYENSNPKDLHLHSLIYDFFHHMEGYHKHIHKPNKPTHLSEKQFNNILQITAYINEHSSSSFSLNDLAGRFNMTPQYMANFIKSSTGRTFYEYLADVRIDKAIGYVRYTDESLFRIAALTGFPNQNAFIKAFKDKTGMSPDDFRASEVLRINGFSSNDFSPISSKELAKDYINNYIPSQETVTPKSTVRQSHQIVLSASRKKESHKPWNHLVNLGFTSTFSRADYRQQILNMQQIMNFEFGRLLRPFDIVHPIFIDNQKMYDFGKLFRVLDFFKEIDLIPFLELGNKPYKININPVDHIKIQNNPKTDDYYSNLIDILPHFLKHCINRYGYDYVSQWKFELWTERLTGHSSQKHETPESYAYYFSQIKNILNTYVPDCKVGGPGYNTINTLSQFGKIMTQLKLQNALPDFITAYIYPYISPDSEQLSAEKGTNSYISPNKNIGFERIYNLHKFCEEHYPEIKDILVTEYAAEVSSRNFINDSIYLATFIARFNTQCADYAKALAYWPLTDISLEYSDSNRILFGGNGLINRNNIYKPGFFAHLFLNKMQKHIIGKGEHYMLTISEDLNHLDLLVFNYAHINDDYSKDNTSYSSLRNPTAVFEQIPPQDLNFKISDIKQGTYRIRHYITNNTYGNLLNEWIRLGIIDNNAVEDIEYLKANSAPHQEMFTQKVTDTLDITCHLSSQEIGVYAIDRMV